jgi:predicted CoA-binding protein
VIAVVGLSPDPRRQATSSGDISWLTAIAYTRQPAPLELLGQRSYPSLSDIPERIDIVDIFRKAGMSSHRGGSGRSAPKAIWLQLGIVNDEARKIAEDSGISFFMTSVSNRNTKGSSESGRRRALSGLPDTAGGQQATRRRGSDEGTPGKPWSRDRLHSICLPMTKRPTFFSGDGTILNVYSGELLKGNIAVRGERSFTWAPRSITWEGHELSRSGGQDDSPWIHRTPFPSLDVYNPVSVGEEACRRGTTTVFCDDLLFYMEMGPELFQEFMDAFSDMPIKYYCSLRTAPQSPMRDEKRVFSVENLLAVLENPRVQSIVRITRWMELIKGTSGIPPVIARTKELKKRVDGHTAGASTTKLNRLALAGIESCHESINGQNVLDRLSSAFTSCSARAR